MLKSSRLLRLAVLLGLAVGLNACDVTKAGESGNLKFKYDADDRIFPPSFNQPVANGLRAGVIVMDNEDQPATVASASSSSNGIFTVPMKSGSTVVLQGEGVGTAKLNVRAGGVEDSIDVSVEDIDKVELQYPSPWTKSQTDPVAVVQDGMATFGKTLKSADGSQLMGYGTLPLTFEPATAAAQTETFDVAHVTLQFAELGDVVIRPQGVQGMTVTVIAVTDVTSFSLEGLLNVQPAAFPRDSQTQIVLKAARADGMPVVGLQNLAVVQSDSTSICSVAAERKLGDGVYVVNGLAVGDCNISATFDQHTANVTVQVTEPTPTQ